MSVRAQRDLQHVWARLSDDSPGAADHVIDLILARCKAVAEAPRTGRPRDEFRKGMRSVSVANHLVFYRPRREGIWVVRIVHGAQDLERLFGA